MMGNILLLILVEIIALLGLRKFWRGWEQPVINLNMVMILLFGAKLISLEGFVTNAGNINYATACVAQLILATRLGEQASIKNLWRVGFAMAFVLSMIWTLALFPVLPGNEEISHIIALIAERSGDFAIASFLAFFIAQFSLLKIYFSWHGTPMWVRFVVGAIACQVLDSVVFFTIAFQLSALQMLEFALTGCIFKIGLMLAFYPIFLYVVPDPLRARE